MRRAVVLLIAVTMAACGSPEPALYTLSAVNGPTLAGGPRTVVVRDVAVAKFLDREHIVRSSEDYRVSVQGNDWWAEPLPAMVSRVLTSELGQRLPGAAVFSGDGAISPVGTLESRVSVNVLRLDADRAGDVVLEAQVATEAPAATRRVRLTARPAGADLRAQVAAMSAALGQLADVIAAMLRG